MSVWSRRGAWGPLLGLLLPWGCDRSTRSAEVLQDAAPVWDVGAPAAPLRQGMVWIPAGTLVAGTPVGELPRVPDAELPGVAIEMQGYFIDRFNQPGEPGALPITSLTQAEARELCQAQGKRLCTEMEWERACKGPDNLRYEYGSAYDAAPCAMGTSDALAPNGSNARCESGFGVRDLHGSAWNWTSSAWGRGSTDKRVTIRGGNSRKGELVGRCANAEAMEPGERSATVGVRCCAGEVNQYAVQLSVRRGSVLSWRPADAATAAKLEALVPRDIRDAVQNRPPADAFKVERVWEWRPVGNEELIVGGGCAHPPGHDRCGVVIGRFAGDGAVEVGFVSSDWWIPTIGTHDAPRTLFIYGGDREGAYKKAVIYEWGRITEGGKWRKKSDGWHAPP